VILLLVSPFENELALNTFIHIDQQNRNFWAALNSQGNKRQFVFGWKWTPIHLKKINTEQIKRIESGLREISPNIRFRFVCHSFPEDSSRQNFLEDLAAKADNPAAKFVIYGEQFRIRELTKSGVRKLKEFFVFVFYEIDLEAEEADGWIEKQILKVVSFWRNYMTNQSQQLLIETYTKLFNAAFNCFLEVEQLLRTKMGLSLAPMDGNDWWRYLRGKFTNFRQESVLPYWLYFDGVNLEERTAFVPEEEHRCVHQVQQLSLVSQLATDDDIPIPSQELIYLPGREKYAGIVTFDSPPLGWLDDISSFSWLWNEIIVQPQIEEVEIVTEYSWMDSSHTLSRIQKFTRQQIGFSSTAQRKNNVDVSSNLAVEEAVDAQASLLKGDKPVYVAVVIVLYAATPQELRDVMRFVKNRFADPARLVEEKNYAWRVWLQTLPIRFEPLRWYPQDYRMPLRASDAVPFLQGVTTLTRSQKGMELIAEHGGAPIFLSLEDDFGSPRHGIVLGKTGSGKSVFVSGILTYVISQNIPVTIVDLPKGNGVSSYRDYNRFFRGAEFDTGKNSNNILELIDLSKLPPELHEERLQNFYKTTYHIVLSLVLDNNNSGEVLPVATIKSIVATALKKFYDDAEIRARFANARRAGIGTSAWQDSPTLKDFYKIFDFQQLELEEFSGEDVQKAFNFVKLRLRYWLDSPIGKAIREPSGFDTSNSRNKLFLLRDLSSDEEAALLGLSAQVAATRTALSAPRSLFYIDEASVLLSFEHLANSVGFLMATARGAGMSLVLSTQDPDILLQCKAGSKILQNLSFKVIGRIDAAALPSFQRVFGYAPEVLSANAEDGFKPDRVGLFSRWLLDDDGLITACRYYSPYNQLALVANNAHEVAIREQYYRESSNEFEAISRLQAKLVEQIRVGAVS
jgi:hypothetical protein